MDLKDLCPLGRNRDEMDQTATGGSSRLVGCNLQLIVHCQHLHRIPTVGSTETLLDQKINRDTEQGRIQKTTEEAAYSLEQLDYEKL